MNTLEVEGPWWRSRLGQRLIVLALVLSGLVLIAQWTGISSRDPAGMIADVRALMASWGALAIVAFAIVFVVGELLQVPGLIFVSVAVISYGQLAGGALGYLTGVISVVVSFWLVRALGGTALTRSEQPWVRKMLKKLHDRPIFTVASLRMVLLMSPVLNYALALSAIRFRDYLIGSVLGLLVPVVLFVILFEQAMRWLGWVA